MGVKSTKNNSYEHFCKSMSRVESIGIGFKLIPSPWYDLTTSPFLTLWIVKERPLTKSLISKQHWERSQDLIYRQH